MKTLSVEEFLQWSSFSLNWFGPVFGHEDKRCLLTLKDVPAITHAVRASDGQVYDVSALQNWLKRQSGPNYFVIPGKLIDNVYGVFWYETIFCRVSLIWQHAKEKWNTVSQPSKTTKGLSVVTVTNAVHKLIRQNKYRPTYDVKIPSHRSAFVTVRKSARS